MIKVLFLLRSLEIGGAERQVVELVKNLDHSRFEVLIVTFYEGGALRPLLEGLPGVTVTSPGKTGRWDLFRFLRNLLSLIRTYQPALIQSYLDVPNIFNVFAGKLLGIKSSLGISASFVDFSRYDWTAPLVFRLGAWASHFADQAIANSQAGEKHHLAHGYSARNLIVIPNGIDTHVFQPLPGAGERLRERWGLRASDKVVGLVGRLDPMKDHPTFLRAAALVAKDHPECRFICIGRGNPAYRDEMKTLAVSLLPEEKVLWIENCADEDLPGAYNTFDVLVSSSYGEGLPVVLGEAMSSGVPCVVTAVGDSALAVGETGLVVPPQAPALLAEALCKILELDATQRLELGQKARQRVIENFSIEKMTTSYEAVFLKLAQS